MTARPSFAAAVGAVLRNELRILFLTPQAWIFLAAFLMLGGFFFVLGLENTGEASLRPVMANLAVTLVFCLPMVTMRQLAEDARTGTLELLLTAPVSPWAVVLGKWLATMLLCTLLLLLTLAYPGILALVGDPDSGVLVTSYVGLLLCCASFAAVGLFASSLVTEQMVAGVLSVLLLLPFWLAGTATSYAPPGLSSLLQELSFLEHLRSFARGVLDVGDIAWFAAFTFLFLFFAWRSLESRRWR